MTAYISVSYTHLDVYKRQILASGNQITADAIVREGSLEAVSYTHLQGGHQFLVDEIQRLPGLQQLPGLRRCLVFQPFGNTSG